VSEIEKGYGMKTQKLTLYRPAVYQIKVLGRADESWADWTGEMTVAVESVGQGMHITSLTGAIDQAALQGLLRRLYSMGLPLVSAVCIEVLE
jgi:hypothetical protein